MVTKSGEVIETSWANIQIPDGRQVGIGIDITERKRAEAELAAFALEQERLNTTNRLLLREVNHRVKNNLTAILSLIYTEKRRLNPEDGFRMESVIDDLAQRVESLAAAHPLLSRSQWQPLRLDMLAGRVIESGAPATSRCSG